MWGQIGDLHARHREVPVEIQLLKLTEETGEAAEAFIGMHGLNSRKGVCRSRDDLLAELADVIITAAVTMTGVTGGDVEEARRLWADVALSRVSGEGGLRGGGGAVKGSGGDVLVGLHHGAGQ